jgi:hypothetical protein
MMSHVVTIQTQVRDPVAIQLACSRLQLPAPRYGTAKLFSSEVTGWQVELPQWRYPVVCEIERGQVQYDNFGGRWGEPARLHQFLQAYAVERARLEARKQGYTATEQVLANGSIQVSIQLGGVA